MLRAHLRRRYRIQCDLILIDTAVFQDLHADGNYLGIDTWISRAKRLGTKLMKLPLPPLLRFLLSKHRADVIDLGQRGFFPKGLLDITAHYRCRCLRPERDTATTLVGKGVHLLVDNVGAFANTARKQLSRFEHRHADFFVVESCHHVADDLFEIYPFARFGRQDINGTFDALVFHNGLSYRQKRDCQIVLRFLRADQRLHARPFFPPVACEQE